MVLEVLLSATITEGGNLDCASRLTLLESRVRDSIMGQDAPSPWVAISPLASAVFAANNAGNRYHWFAKETPGRTTDSEARLPPLGVSHCWWRGRLGYWPLLTPPRDSKSGRYPSCRLTVSLPRLDIIEVYCCLLSIPLGHIVPLVDVSNDMAPHDWHEASTIALKRRAASIAAHYKTPAWSEEELPRNLTGFALQSSYYTDDEVDIIQSEADVILERVRTSTWTALKVAKAFCKASALAQELVWPRPSPDCWSVSPDGARQTV